MFLLSLHIHFMINGQCILNDWVGLQNIILIFAWNLKLILPVTVPTDAIPPSAGRPSSTYNTDHKLRCSSKFYWHIQWYYMIYITFDQTAPFKMECEMSWNIIALRVLVWMVAQRDDPHMYVMKMNLNKHTLNYFPTSSFTNMIYLT